MCGPEELQMMEAEVAGCKISSIIREGAKGRTRGRAELGSTIQTGNRWEKVCCRQKAIVE